MSNLNWKQVNLSDVEKIAKTIRMKLKKNLILSISGPLGVGKTTLIKQILPEFDVKSPSFLHALYYGSDFAHLDAYTFASQEAFLSLDIPEILYDRCLIIEWGELVNFDIFDVEIIKVHMKINNNKRFINF